MCEIVVPDETQVTNLPQICAHTTPSEATTEERRFENMWDIYKAAVQNGVETMYCGRICVIGNHLRDVIKASTSEQSVYTLNNDTFSPMTEVAEREGLAVLENKVIAKNTDSSLIKVINKFEPRRSI